MQTIRSISQFLLSENLEKHRKRLTSNGLYKPTLSFQSFNFLHQSSGLHKHANMVGLSFPFWGQHMIGPNYMSIAGHGPWTDCTMPQKYISKTWHNCTCNLLLTCLKYHGPEVIPYSHNLWPTYRLVKNLYLGQILVN